MTVAPAIDDTMVEPPLTLDEPPTRMLGTGDQLVLWWNLGVSLLLPVTATFLLQPGMSLVAALVAIALGTVLGNTLLGLGAMAGAETGAPSMVLLRGLFGRRVSYLPTCVNVVQLIGWAVFEIVVITQAAQQLLPWHGVRWPYIVAAGALTTLMAIRPLGVVRILRRYALVLVALATIYLYVQLLRHPHPSLTDGSWSGFFPASDSVIGAAVSFAPLASDYSRHSRTRSAAFGGTFVGYSVASLASYILGLVALATVVQASSADLQHDMFATFIAVPVGWLAFGILVARELDQSFADSYSTVMSVQNVVPRFDRRILAVVVGGGATLLALALTIDDYYNFLLLLGSVFVPLTAVLLVDYFLGRRDRWDVSEHAPARWAMVVPWVAGFVTYQLVNPGYVTWWVDGWSKIAGWIDFTPSTWMSASVLSFLVAAAVTLPLTLASRRRGPSVGAAASSPTGSPGGAARS
jgi:nucleobase:cation symporter-1, NCS1 family